MKKIILLFLIIISCWYGFSVSAEKKVTNNEDNLIKVLNQDCPIIVEEIKITMDVLNVTEPANLKIDYLFNNSTNENYVLNLAIPYHQDQRIKLFSNETEIIAKKRYTFDETYNFYGEYLSLSGLEKTTRVKKYSYKIVSEEFKNYSSLAIFSNIVAENIFFLTSTKEVAALNNGKSIACEIHEGQVFDIYVIGEHDSLEFNWKLFKNQQVLMQEVVGTIEKIEEKEMELFDVFVENNVENIENDIDLFNLCLENIANSNNKVICVNELLTQEEIDSYLVYDLIIPANGQANHITELEVTPFINKEYSPNIYEYLFSLEGFDAFKEIQKIEWNVNSLNYLVDTNMSFENNENGYLVDVNRDNKYISLSFSTALHPEPNLDMLELSIKIVVSSLALLVLFYLVFCLKSIRRKYRLENYRLPKKIEFIYQVQNLLAIISIVLSLLGMHFQILFGAISLVVVLLAFVLALISRYKYQQKNVFGIAALALAIVSYLNLWHQFHDLFEVNTVIVTICILVYGINNIVLFNDVDFNRLEEYCYLPLDFLSKKAYVFYSLFTLILMVAGMTLLVYDFNIWNIIGITFVSFILIILYRVVKVVLIDYRPLKKYYRNLDYELLKIQIENKLTNDGINPKTYNGYLLRLAEIAIGNDRDDYIKYLSSFKRVSKEDSVDIDCLKLNWFLTKKEYFKLYEELVYKFNNRTNLLNKLEKRYRFWLPYYNGTIEESIILQYPYHDKVNKWNNARNLFIQVNYYFQKENLGKARELWKYYIQNYNDVYLFTEKLNELHLNKW